MASFIEAATLLVRDKSTSELKKINKEANALLKTMKKLDKIKIRIQGLSQLQKQLQQVTRAVQQMQRSGNRQTNIRVNAPNANAVNRQLQTMQNRMNQLRRQRANLNLNARGGGGANALGPSGARVWGTTAGNVFANIITGALREIGQHVIKGATDQDIAQTRLSLTEIGASDVEKRQIDFAIDDLMRQSAARKGGSLLNRQQYEQMFAENLPGTVGEGGKFNVEATKMLIDQVASVAELQTSVGIPYEQAVEEAIKFNKALVDSGRLFSETTQLFDPAQAERQYNLVRQVIRTVGKEATGPWFQSVLSNMPRARATMTDDALMRTLFVSEEAKTRFATALETLGNSLFKTKRKADSPEGEALVATGLRTVAGKGTTEVDAKFAEYRADPFSIVDEIQAYMQHRGFKNISPDAATGGVNFSRADVAAAVGEMVPTARAGGAFEEIVNKVVELNRTLEFAKRFSGTIADTRKITDESWALTTATLATSFEGLAGQIFRQMEPVIRPEVDKLNKTLAESAEQVARGESTEKVAKTMAQGIGELLGGPGGDMLGYGAIAQGMAQFIGGADPLTKAAGILTTAAGYLLIAGKALAGNSLVQAVDEGFALQRIVTGNAQPGDYDTIANKKPGDDWSDVVFGREGTVVRSVTDWLAKNLSMEANADELNAVIVKAQKEKTGETWGQILERFKQDTKKRNTIADERHNVQAELVRQQQLELDLRRQLGEMAEKESRTQRFQDVKNAIPGVVENIAELEATIVSLNKQFAKVGRNEQFGPPKPPSSFVSDYGKRPDQIMSGTGTGTGTPTEPALTLNWDRISKVGRLAKKKQIEAIKLFQEGKGLPVTGVADEQTMKYIKDFQAEFKLVIDGIVGKQTDSALRYLRGLEYFGEEVDMGGDVPTPTPRPGRNRSFLPTLNPPPGTFQPDEGKRPDQLVDTNAITAANDAGARAIQTAFNTGATEIATAGSGAGSKIATGVSSAGTAITNAFNTGGASAAALIRAALSTPVSVNMPNTVVAKAETGFVGGTV